MHVTHVTSSTPLVSPTYSDKGVHTQSSLLRACSTQHSLSPGEIKAAMPIIAKYMA
jgi:hypothetical protein